MKAIDRLNESTPENDSQLKESFDVCWNEIYDLINVCGYEYEPAKVLENVDPVAYYQECLSWLDGFRRDGESELPGGRWMCSECRETWSTREDAEKCCVDGEENV